MSVIRCMHADWIKSRRTPLPWIHVLFPLIGAGVFAGYFHISGWSEITNVMTFLEVMAIVFPFIIGIVVGIVVQLESSAGHFQVMLGTMPSRAAVYIGKLLYLIMLADFSTVFCILLFAMLYPVMPLAFYFKPLIMLLLSILPLYLISLLAGFGLGKSVCMGMGIVGSLLAAVLMTGLGDTIWKFIPWGWSIRFMDFCVFEYSYPEQGKQVSQEFQEGLGILVIVTVILVIGSLIWFQRWEGTRENE